MATSIIRHELPDAYSLDIGADTYDVTTAVTVIVGEVIGEIDRFVGRDDADGPVVLSYAARIDGLDQSCGAGTAQIEVESAQALASLATVSGLLSHELARLKGNVAHGGTRSMVFPTLEGGELSVDLEKRTAMFNFAGAAVTLSRNWAWQLANAITEELAD